MYSMYIRTFALGCLIVGLAFAGTLKDLPKYEYDLKNHSSLSPNDVQFDLLEQNNSHKTKWENFKNKVFNIFDTLEDDWFIGENYTKNILKEEASLLISDTEKLYHGVIVKGEDLYSSLEIHLTELKSSMANILKKVDITQIESFISEVKNDIENSKVTKAIEAGGDFVFSVTGLKDDWNSVKETWSRVYKDISSLFDIAIKDFNKFKKRTQLLSKRIGVDLKKIKDELLSLVEEAKKTFKAVIHDGEDALDHFEKLFSRVVKIIKDVKPILGDIFKDIEKMLEDLGSYLKEYVRVKIVHKKAAQPKQLN